jgi:NAD(P)H-hydrate repair Nnr-like enzyme with NAD(P)H-hydrate epimerase domain
LSGYGSIGLNERHLKLLVWFKINAEHSNKLSLTKSLKNKLARIKKRKIAIFSLIIDALQGFGLKRLTAFALLPPAP